MGVARRTEELPAHEELLLDYAQRLRKHIAGRRAVHLHLSRLQRHNRRPQHLRAAVGSFPRLIAAHDGQCYSLANGDIVVVVKDASVAAIDDVVLRLRYLFKEDPLANDEGEDGAAFCTWFDLERDYEAFLRTAVLLEQAHHAHRRHKPLAAASAAGDALAPVQPFDAAWLDRLAGAVAALDLAPLLDRQRICALLPEQAPAPIFSELKVAVAALRRQKLPELDFADQPWLFQPFTRSLDRRVLRDLPKLAAEAAEATSIDIDVATVLAPAFQELDRRLRARSAPPLILEMQAIDVLSDLDAYRRARDLARGRNYRIGLDDVSHLGFPLLPHDELGFDFAKITWNPAMSGGLSPERLRGLRQAVARCGRSRVVLSHCDDKVAVNAGQLLGISLFQGGYVDRLIGQA